MVKKSENKIKSLIFIDKLYLGILLIIFGGIILHAPISVGFSTLLPNYSLLIKSWKEILMLIAGFIALYLLYKNKQFKILRDPILLAIAAYGLLHLLLLGYMPQGTAASLAGLAIDLRYVLYFVLVYIAIRLYPKKRKMFISVGVAGALIVLIFALLQVFILPHDVLKYIGYNLNTIKPYLTIDQNYDFIRINSTLRGPNPLGAYVAMVLAMVVAAGLKHKIKKDRLSLIVIATLILGGATALYASYSRSALIGLIVALVIIIVANFKKLSKKFYIACCACLLLIGTLLMLGNAQFVSNVIFHINPNGGSNLTSNQGHVESLGKATNQTTQLPLGAGIGSTGSASILNNRPELIENQFLYITHEVGWLGLALFIFILISILVRLWGKRDDWLALGVFASGIGLIFICMFLPIWVDDTISIVWWGLAAIALGGGRYIVDSRLKNNDRQQ